MDVFEQTILHKAFDMVADPADWRAPINAEVFVEDIMMGSVIQKAVEFFTATRAVIRRIESEKTCGIGPRQGYWLHVKADGYRMGPAS